MKEKKDKKDKAVHVEWVDSMSSSGWQRNKHEDSDMNCETIGFLEDKNESRIKVYQNKSAYSNGAYMEIPMCAVKKIKYLK